MRQGLDLNEPNPDVNEPPELPDEPEDNAPDRTTPPAPPEFAYNAANLALALPLISTVITGALTPQLRSSYGLVMTFAGFTVTLLIAFILGIYALASMRRLGTKRLLFRSLIGVVLSGFLIYVSVTGFLDGRKTARERHEAAERSQQGAPPAGPTNPRP